MQNKSTIILGAGITGLAAGLASGLSGYEANNVPGGICSSYYLRPGETKRLHTAPKDGEAYRFEIGGGHWIFGGDPLVLHFIRSITPVRAYTRKSAVYLPDQKLFVPYPIQNHLRYLGSKHAAKVLQEMVKLAADNHQVTCMADWLRANFGPTLCKLFFEPFHELYTAGLWKRIAPQDGYKSPVDLSLAIQGVFGEASSVGYNVSFIYPIGGLNTLAQRMASKCKIHFGDQVEKIDVKDRIVLFESGSELRYEFLLSTLPLNKMVEIAVLKIEEKSDPSSSVLVINIGAVRGAKCPQEHWLYIPNSKAGFHRVGFYSNVDASFLPASSRKAQNRVSIYVERSYPEGQEPSADEVQALCNEVIRELQDWGWIQEAEAVDPTWIDVAYTWSWPGSKYKHEAMKALESGNIYQVGRYARWKFQGIADSIRDGLIAGSALGIKR